MTQGNFFTGTTAGGDTLEVTDGTTTNTDVRKIIVSAGTITASSGHTVTVTTGGGGAGGIGGTIAITQVAYGSGADTIKGEAAFTYTEGTDTLSVGVVATTGTGVSVGGTGTITTSNGSISAGGATGSVSANTTVAAGTTVTAGTDVISTGGQVVASGTPTGSSTGPGLVVAENSILKGTFTDFSVTGDMQVAEGGGALVSTQLGQSRWSSAGEVNMTTALGTIDLSDARFFGAQMQITAGAAGLVIHANGAPAGGTVTAVIGNASAITVASGPGNGVDITIPAYETVVLQVAGNLTSGTSFGSNTLGTGVLVVLGKCTLTAI
jgi:fibronectin-binding autotransporter adhesin